MSGRPSPEKKRGLVFWLGISIGSLLILVLLALPVLFYLTTDSGARTWVLPWISKKFGMEVAAGKIDWHLFSSIRLDDVRIGSTQEPLFRARRVTADYKGIKFLLGEYAFESLAMDSPQIRLVRQRNGSYEQVSPSFQTSPNEHPGEPRSKHKKAAPPRISFSKLEIENLELIYATPDRRLVVRNLKCSAQNIQPAQAASMTLDGAFSVQDIPRSSMDVSGRIQSELQGQLDERLRPITARGQIRADSLEGNIGKESVREYSAQFDVDLAASAKGPHLLKQGALTIRRGESVLTTLSALGPFDLQRGEADLDLQAGPIQRDVLNLLFASKGLDFQNSLLSYVGHLNLSQGGDILKLNGRLEANPFTFSTSNVSASSWKPMTLSAEHALTVDRARRQVLVEQFKIDASQDQTPRLKGSLNRPLAVSWDDKGDSQNVGDAEFTLQIFPWDIAPLMPLLDMPPHRRLHSGLLEGRLNISTSEQGHRIEASGRLDLTGISASFEKTRLTDAALHLDGKTAIRNLQNFQFQSLNIQAAEKGNTLANLTLNGNIDAVGGERTGSGILQVQGSLPHLLALRPIPQLAVSRGELSGKVDWKLTGRNQAVCSSRLSLQDLSFLWDRIRYDRATVNFTGQTQWTPSALKIENASMTALLGEEPSGSWKGDISYSRQTSDFQMTFQMEDWKQPILAPLVAAWLPKKELRSAELTGKGEVRRQKGILEVEADARIKDLRVKEPGLPSPKSLNPYASTHLTYAPDGTVTLHSFQVELDPTATAQNQLQITGVLQASSTRLFADLKILGKSLDLTPYYDQLFAQEPKAGLSEPTAPPSKSKAPELASSSSPAPTERTRDISLQVSIDSLKIRELIVNHLNFPFRQKENAIELPEVHFNIGETPVFLKISSASKGEVSPFQFEARTEGLRLGPLVDVFKPELKGQVGGILTAKAYGNGMGLSRKDLDQNLEGVVELAIREAHLEKLPSAQKSLKQLSLLLQSPEIANSTINNIDASGKISGGKIHTDNFHAKGSALEASLVGDLFFDKRLSMEAKLKLQRNAIDQSALLRPLLQVVTSEQKDWIQLPGSAQISGTLDDPVINVDKTKLATEALIKSGINVLKEFLKPKQKETTPNPAQPEEKPSAPAQPQTPVEDLLKNLFRKKR